MSGYTLLPEWAEQEAVILAWPFAATDWVNNLSAARATYITLIDAITHADATVIMLCPPSEIDSLEIALNDLTSSPQVLIVKADYNDTWVRDYGFLTVSDNQNNFPVSFTFNGWGQKFDAQRDNQVNDLLASLCQNEMLKHDIVLEGGALEIDENQHLLSTGSCLFNPKRNGHMQAEEYRTLFTQALGAKTISIFNHGYLEGDDTDGHIDTLARFTPLMGVVLQGSDNRPHDPHFAELFKLQYEVSQALPKHKIYSLPLPLVVNEDDERLPASYANYLILNRHILMPVYGALEDNEAMQVVQSAYPNYKVVPIDCLSLVQQYGSLHCITMQVPTNTLKQQILDKASHGVAIL